MDCTEAGLSLEVTYISRTTISFMTKTQRQASVMKNCAWKGKMMDSVKLLVSVMAWFGIWLIICPLETG